MLTLRRIQNEFLQVGAIANALRHRVINCHSNALQIKVTADCQPITVAKVGLINDRPTNRRSCNWRIKMCGKTKSR